ncbi:hypothetical protein [Enterococcus rivorum]|uniref:hypothetical protein n=1 Tax=Enterococcus rivorum TaxID=762845 RepID=UPI00362B0C2C
MKGATTNEQNKTNHEMGVRTKIGSNAFGCAGVTVDSTCCGMCGYRNHTIRVC